jgi:hypothetical protein
LSHRRDAKNAEEKLYFQGTLLHWAAIGQAVGTVLLLLFSVGIVFTMLCLLYYAIPAVRNMEADLPDYQAELIRVSA